MDGWGTMLRDLQGQATRATERESHVSDPDLDHRRRDLPLLRGLHVYRVHATSPTLRSMVAYTNLVGSWQIKLRATISMNADTDASTQTPNGDGNAAA